MVCRVKDTDVESMVYLVDICYESGRKTIDLSCGMLCKEEENKKTQSTKLISYKRPNDAGNHPECQGNAHILKKLCYNPRY